MWDDGGGWGGEDFPPCTLVGKSSKIVLASRESSLKNMLSVLIPYRKDLWKQLT